MRKGCERHPNIHESRKEPNIDIAMLPFCSEQEDFEIKECYKHLTSLSLRPSSATLLTNSAANGKFKAAETKAVLSINKTKSCEF